jgi:hypothetical protein
MPAPIVTAVMAFAFLTLSVNQTLALWIGAVAVLMELFLLFLAGTDAS